MTTYTYPKDRCPPGTPIEQRLMRYVSKCASTGCWNWTGHKNSCGYGSITISGKSILAHRVSYQVFVEEIKEGYVICHKCDNPSCINPDHLFQGTLQDNQKDSFRKGRNPYFVRRGNNHRFSKLKESDIPVIREQLCLGVSPTKIAKVYGVDDTTIFSIKNRKTWRWI